MCKDGTPGKRGRPKGRKSLKQKRRSVAGQAFLGAAHVAAALLKRGRNRAYIRSHLLRAYGYRSRQADKAIDFARMELLPGWRPKGADEFWTTGQSTPDFLKSAYAEFLGSDGAQAYEGEVADLFRVAPEWVRLPK